MTSPWGRAVSAAVLAAGSAAASAFAADARPTPVSATASGFAVSQNVRDLPAARPDPNSPLPAEWIRDNDRLPRAKGPFAAGPRTDGALSGDVAALSSAMPSPSGSFSGVSAAQSGAATGGLVVPPDTVGAVGPNHYVQAVNTVFRVFDKSGSALSSIVALGTFFGPLGSGCSGNFGDPTVLYDPLADRWLISQFGLPNYPNPPYHECVAISQTPDPTSAFYLYDFVMPNKLNDYPHFGVWPDGYYMSDNQFFPGGGSWAGAGLLAFDRSKMLVGDSSATYIYFDYYSIDPTAGGMLPTGLDGLAAPPVGTPNLFMEFRATAYGDPNDALRIYEFHADFVNPGNSTLTVLPDLVTAVFDARTPGTRNVVEEPPPAGSADYVDAIADRMMHRIAYRTLAGGVMSYVANWTVNVSGVNPVDASTYQAGVRFTELRRDPGTGAMSILNQVTYAPGSGNGATGRNVWMGSAAQDNQGNSVVGFSASSTTLFPSIVWAGRLAGDAANSLAQGEATVMTGLGSQQQSFNRWGDYSAMTVDPSDDCTFFYTQEFYPSSSQFNWVTNVAKFAYPGCTPAPSGTVTGTVTACANGAALAGAVVSDGAGHVRVTDASGNFSMTLPPGSYTLTVVDPPYLSGGGSVSVVNGSSTTFNTCLTGVPVLAASGAALSAESCLPPNNVPDPGETVTVSFCIQNSGGADTTDLVATLQASGGVVNPPAPVDFGVVHAGGAPVCRDLTFMVDPALACGDTLTLSLALTDAGTGIGSVSQDFRTGIAISALVQNFDGAVPPALPSGWTAANAQGLLPVWSTTTNAPDSPPNTAFIDDPGVISDKRMTSPSIAITSASARLTFHQSFGFEDGFDGGVLEISIGGAPFQDVLDAGGSFLAGGYNGTIGGSTGNPLANRSAWTGSSGGYMTTVVALPPSAAGSSIQLRWRMGSDNGTSGAGWSVDTISVVNGFLCCSAPTPTAVAVDMHVVTPPSNVNGVWEPGETVAVEPAYLNNSTATVALAGTISNLTGPAGAAYGVVDGAASYGSLASGAGGSCTAVADCYAVSVDAPATRPAAHWDATLTELLSTGLSKTWILHIGSSFADVPTSNPFYAFVEDIFHHGVTGGCASGAYCPDQNVTRAQMAVFLLKAAHGPGFTPPACSGVFADVPCPSLFANWIEELHNEGITGGCGGSNYCPNNPVTRAQMAVFLLKAKHGSSYVPPACIGVFGDVPCPSPFADWIEDLAAEGVTAGCGGGNYCPSSPNTRGQMAVFLAKTFGLLLYGP